MHNAHRTQAGLKTCLYADGRKTRRFGLSLLVAALTLFVAVAGSVVIAAQAAPAKTVWDGAYTDAQAARATAVFGASCSNCHSITAEGTNRPLIGDKFWQGYTQKTVGDLLTFVKTNMPNGNGGSLPAATYNDLVALILKSNGFPAGATEVAPETVANIQIVPKDGPGELPAGTLVRVVGCLVKTGSDWTLTNATAPERTEKSVVGPEDATRPLGDRTVALKFVLSRLDSFAGQRMSATGLLMGAGGVNGINVSTVNRVAEACP
jgi:mono/diheme cytochrome c family protein